MNRHRYSLPPAPPVPQVTPAAPPKSSDMGCLPVAERQENRLYKAAVERAFSRQQPERDPLREMFWGNG
jgi:hypothetical protein